MSPTERLRLLLLLLFIIIGYPRFCGSQASILVDAPGRNVFHTCICVRRINQNLINILVNRSCAFAFSPPIKSGFTYEYTD